MPILLQISLLSLVPAEPGWLSAEEGQRLNSLGDALRRRQFLAGHCLARQLAARHSKSDAGQWAFTIAADGRRWLEHPEHSALAVSISHAGEQVAVAVAEQPIGVDLENARQDRDWSRLAQAMFSPQERQALEAGEDTELGSRFLQLWTLKEAWAKRSGRGLQRHEARRCSALPAAAGYGEALHWQLPGGGWLSLAAWPGADIELHGVEAQASHWCYTDSNA